MKRRIFISILILSALGLAVVLGGAAYQAARAATSAPAALAHGGRGPGFGYTNEDLANALGITVDELNAAYTKAYEAALSQAVEKGLITQAQADDLKTRGYAFPFGARWSGWLSQNGIDFQALLAKELGITVEKLQAAYQEAFYARIDQGVADGRLTAEQADQLKGEYALRNSSQFQSAMQSAFEAAVKQAVASGVITQAQADLILQNQAGRGFFGKGGFDGFGGMPGGRGRGGQRGWGFEPGAPDMP